jgi:ribosome-associated toxin RatA of RatAB toxin-antitoxin module
LAAHRARHAGGPAAGLSAGGGVGLRWAAVMAIALGQSCADHAARAAPDPWQVRVEVAPRDGAFAIDASGRVDAPLDVVWETVTDYDHLGRFVPGMESSRVLSRQGSRVTVAQRGHASLWIVSWPVDVVVESVERPRESVEVHLVSGNLRKLEGSYRFQPLAAGVSVRWEGIVEPALPLPRFLARRVVLDNARQQFEALLAEIERRHGSR